MGCHLTTSVTRVCIHHRKIRFIHQISDCGHDTSQLQREKHTSTLPRVGLRRPHIHHAGSAVRKTSAPFVTLEHSTMDAHIGLSAYHQEEGETGSATRQQFVWRIRSQLRKRASSFALGAKRHHVEQGRGNLKIQRPFRRRDVSGGCNQPSHFNNATILALRWILMRMSRHSFGVKTDSVASENSAHALVDKLTTIIRM